MTQEEINAILGDNTYQSSIEVVLPPEEEDDSMEGDPLDIVKDISTAVCYLNKKKLCTDLLREYNISPEGSYIYKVSSYRIVVAALTDNEKRHLTRGHKWYPLVQFCKPGREKNCLGSKVIGTIELEGETFNVVGGYAAYGGGGGISSFIYGTGASGSFLHMGLQSVSSERVAKYISEQFGQLLVEVYCSGINCNWRWKS